jgi:hypothetical protein
MRTLTSFPARPKRGRASGSARGSAFVRRCSEELAPEMVERIAGRVVQLLREQRLVEDTAPRLVTADELARRFGLTRTWVYEHANELGAISMGDGPRARMRFDLRFAGQAIYARRRLPQAHSGGLERSVPRPGRPRRRREPEVPLLPVYESGVRGIAARRVRLARGLR